MHRAKDGLVLDRRGDDCFTTVGFEGAPGAENGEVVGLGAAGGEADLVRTCS